MSTPNPYVPRGRAPAGRGADGLADILERVLDKGLVIAGDIQVNLLDIELLTIKVRLLLASADTAQQMGIDWWQHDPFLTSRGGELADENAELRDRVARLEELLAGRTGEPPAVGDGDGAGGADQQGDRTTAPQTTDERG